MGVATISKTVCMYKQIVFMCPASTTDNSGAEPVVIHFIGALTEQGLPARQCQDTGLTRRLQIHEVKSSQK